MVYDVVREEVERSHKYLNILILVCLSPVIRLIDAHDSLRPVPSWTLGDVDEAPLLRRLKEITPKVSGGNVVLPYVVIVVSIAIKFNLKLSKVSVDGLNRFKAVVVLIEPDFAHQTVLGEVKVLKKLGNISLIHAIIAFTLANLNGKRVTLSIVAVTVFDPIVQIFSRDIRTHSSHRLFQDNCLALRANQGIEVRLPAVTEALDDELITLICSMMHINHYLDIFAELIVVEGDQTPVFSLTPNVVRVKVYELAHRGHVEAGQERFIIDLN